jgi:hypothetical protein
MMIYVAVGGAAAVVAVAGLVGGVVLFLRHQRRRGYEAIP